jgi:hypothetical protein
MEGILDAPLDRQSPREAPQRWLGVAHHCPTRTLSLCGGNRSSCPIMDSWPVGRNARQRPDSAV